MATIVNTHPDRRFSNFGTGIGNALTEFVERKKKREFQEAVDQYKQELDAAKTEAELNSVTPLSQRVDSRWLDSPEAVIRMQQISETLRERRKKVITPETELWFDPATGASERVEKGQKPTSPTMVQATDQKLLAEIEALKARAKASRNQDRPSESERQAGRLLEAWGVPNTATTMASAMTLRELPERTQSWVGKVTPGAASKAQAETLKRVRQQLKDDPTTFVNAIGIFDEELNKIAEAPADTPRLPRGAGEGETAKKPTTVSAPEPKKNRVGTTGMEAIEREGAVVYRHADVLEKGKASEEPGFFEGIKESASIIGGDIADWVKEKISADDNAITAVTINPADPAQTGQSLIDAVTTARARGATSEEIRQIALDVGRRLGGKTDEEAAKLASDAMKAAAARRKTKQATPSPEPGVGAP